MTLLQCQRNRCTVLRNTIDRNHRSARKMYVMSQFNKTENEIQSFRLNGERYERERKIGFSLADQLGPSVLVVYTSSFTVS